MARKIAMIKGIPEKGHIETDSGRGRIAELESVGYTCQNLGDSKNCKIKVFLVRATNQSSLELAVGQSKCICEITRVTIGKSDHNLAIGRPTKHVVICNYEVLSDKP